jgi:hypothetical protein
MGACSDPIPACRNAASGDAGLAGMQEEAFVGRQYLQELLMDR